MAQKDEPTPEEWREILANFTYPDEVKETPRRRTQVELVVAVGDDGP
ncbi:hypothetical protein [Streptomyces sp. H27-H5]|nr:hypothetical protein [Streptomyces sp. H27-H5]MCY0962969.1 hypothetical protein [Streptomyces sp. H27-H5]